MKQAGYQAVGALRLPIAWSHLRPNTEKVGRIRGLLVPRAAGWLRFG
jgi:hypothetical protein